MNTLLSRTLQDEPINEKLIRGIEMNEVLIQALDDFTKTKDGRELIEKALKKHQINQTKIETPKRCIHAENLDFLRGMFGLALDQLIEDGELVVV